MDYSEAISKAWKIIWRFKILWLLGLLSSCSGGSTIVPSFNYRFSPGELPFMGGGSLAFSRVTSWFESIPVWVWITVAAGIFMVGVVFFLLSLVGRAGLKRGAWQADEGAAALPLSDLFKDSLVYFWRMLGVTVLMGLPGFVFVVINLALFAGSIIGLVADQAVHVSILLLCTAVPLFCLALPLSWLLGMLSELCTSALIAENLGVIASIKRGWTLFWKKPGSVILVSLLLFVIQIVVGILSSIPLAAVIVPLVLGGIATGFNGALVAGVILAVILLPLIGLFVNSLLHAYSSSLWMLTFKRLTALPPAVAAYTPAAPGAF
jgi:hypothetical protein